MLKIVAMHVGNIDTWISPPLCFKLDIAEDINNEEALNDLTQFLLKKFVTENSFISKLYSERKHVPTIIENFEKFIIKLQSTNCLLWGQHEKYWIKHEWLPYVTVYDLIEVDPDDVYVIEEDCEIILAQKAKELIELGFMNMLIKMDIYN